MKIGMDHNIGLTDTEDINLYEKRDKHSPKAYEIIRDEIVGRHMIAARDIDPGEIILIEDPLSFGPTDTFKPVCLGCYRSIYPDSYVSCPECGFPVCSLECSLISDHSDNECREMKKKGFKIDPTRFKWDGRCERFYGAISPIRTFLMKDRNPEIWNLVWMHMSHHKSRSQSTFWAEKTRLIIQDMKMMMATISEDDIETIEILLGILLVNDFEICVQDDRKRDETSSIRGLFALASMPNHDCVANCSHSFSGRDKGFQMTMKAVLPIKAGQEITHSYTEPLDHILKRRSLLQVGKFFKCNCIRCRDPTEMGTYSSALKCLECRKGYIIPSDIDIIDSDWACNSCGSKKLCSKVQSIFDEIKKEADRIEVRPTIDDFEGFLTRYSEILHPNHVFLIDKSYTLAKMYGRMDGYEPDTLTDEQFERKKDLCRRVIRVMDVIMPGNTRKKGMMLYELHLPLVMMANRQLQRGPGGGRDPQQIKKDLREGLDCLKECLPILMQEPEDSFERKIALGSEESIKQLEDWVKTVESSL